jgi:hypothetical protein
MFDEMWKGQKVFIFATTLHVIVVDALKEALAQLRPTNVNFTEI